MNNLKLLKICIVFSYLQVLYLLPCILHLAIGVPSSNLCSSISSSRKFDLPPPLFPAWDGCPCTVPETPHAHFPVREQGDIMAPETELQLWVYWIWKAQVFSWLVEGSGHSSCTLLLSVSAWNEMAILIDSWDHIAQWAQAIVPGGNMVSWVSLLFLHLLLDTAG